MLPQTDPHIFTNMFIIIVKASKDIWFFIKSLIITQGNRTTLFQKFSTFKREIAEIK